MKIRSIIIIFVSFVLFSFQVFAIGTNTVHIYKCDKNESDRNNMNGGYYFQNKETGEIVGFALNQIYVGTTTVIKLSEKEYLDYVCNIKIIRNGIEMPDENKTKLAVALLEEKKNPKLLFMGQEVKNIDDVKRISKEKISELLSDKLENNELNLVMLLFAYSGKLQFNQTGIQGVGTQLEADNYLTNFYNNTIKKINNIKNQARQFIQSNNLN